MIISTGSRLSPGFTLMDRAILEALGDNLSNPVDTYAENLDILRFPSDRFGRIFGGYLTEKYAEQPPDLIVLVFVGNLGVAGKLLHEIFPGTPVVVAGATEEEVRADRFRSPVSGVAARVNPRATLELIFRLQPETRRVVVVGGTAEVDRQVLDRVKEVARSFEGRARFDFWDNRSIAELRQAVAILPSQTVILISRTFRDGSGQAVISTQVGQSISQWANVPVYAMTGTALGTGVVGGSMNDVYSIGKRAGEMARLILNGTPPASLPLETDTGNVPTFDWRALKRWGISESRLPPNSVVRFRPASLWDQYRWYVIGALLIICVQGAMIADLLLQRARRRRAEAGLLESRQFMELATEAGGIGLWVRNLVQRDLWVNPRLRSLLGFGQTDVLGVDDVLARVHPDDRARVMSVIQRAEETAIPFDLEFRTAIPDTPERWIAVRGKFMRGPQGQPLRRMGTMIDITGRKLAEQQLWKSEENFRRLVENTSAVIRQADINTGVFSYVGPQAVKLLGYPLEKWYEKDFWISHIHPDDRERTVNTCLTMSKSAQEFDFEYRMIRASGEVVWIHDIVNCEYHDGKRTQLRGLMLDITERKRAEESLRESEEHYRALTETASDVIITIDQNSTILFVNGAVEKIFGYVPAELIGQKITALMPELLRHRHMEGMRRYLETGDKLLSWGAVSFPGLHKSGREISLEIAFAESGIGDKRVFTGIMRDITERKRAEAELRQQRDELAHLTRVSTMGELAASLAHELNQPLTAILSNAQAAQRFLSGKPSDIEEVREILSDIVQDDNRAGEVIRRMRALVKKEELEFSSLDLASVIREIMLLVHSDAVLRKVRVSADVKADLPHVRGNKIELQQVLLNLLLNAFDAMKDCPLEQREVLVRVESDGPGLVRASVRDRGTGLTSDKLDRIFQPFFTTKRDGLGMGLSISRSIIETHGGCLWAENNPDRGATFYFALPIAKEEQEKSRVA